MMRWRPVVARIRCRAAIVASVPELAKRHNGRPKRRASSTETGIRSGVGWAKWVPRPTCRLTASTIAGWAWPITIVPKPACMSTYSLPSTSHTWAPLPWLIHTGHGGASCHDEATPPASDAHAVTCSACDSEVRARRLASSRAIRTSSASGPESVSGLTSAMGNIDFLCQRQLLLTRQSVVYDTDRAVGNGGSVTDP